MPPLPQPRRIALCTGGGDAPGLNAVIQAAAMAAHRRGWECLGIRDGYNGILAAHSFRQGGVVPLTPDDVCDIARQGGSILGCTNQGNPFAYVNEPHGSKVPQDRSQEVIRYFAQHQIDALIAIGGDGSLSIAHQLAQLGLRVVGVPKTIDNDLDHTAITFGFDTAVSFATDCLDRLHSTAASHHRIMVVEVMGRYAGWIALHAGLAGGAHAIVIPEIPFDLQLLAQAVQQRDAAGHAYTLVVVAEGAVPRAGTHVVAAAAQAGHVERLGGIGEQLAHDLMALTGKDARAVSLGHLLRGGSPSALDRIAALRFGAAAVRALEEGLSDVMVALAPPDVVYVPLSEVAGHIRSVPVWGDTVQTARELGICLGDAL